MYESESNEKLILFFLDDSGHLLNAGEVMPFVAINTYIKRSALI